jgi:hypothetical protein
VAKLLNVSVGTRRAELLGNASVLWQAGSFLHWVSDLYSEVEWEEKHFVVNVYWEKEHVQKEAWQLLQMVLECIHRLVYLDPGRGFPLLEVQCPRQSCNAYSNEVKLNAKSVCQSCHDTFWLDIVVEDSNDAQRKSLQFALRDLTGLMCAEFHSNKIISVKTPVIYGFATQAQKLLDQLLVLDWREASTSCGFLTELTKGQEEEADAQPALDLTAEGLLHVANLAQPIFEQKLVDLLSRCGSDKSNLHIGPLKTLERLKVKLAQQALQGMCFDLNRATILCSNMEEFLRVTTNMALVFYHVRKLKNKFKLKLTEPPCLFYQVELAAPELSSLLASNKHWVVEIQVTTPEFYATKQLCHPVYEILRVKDSATLPDVCICGKR